MGKRLRTLSTEKDLDILLVGVGAESVLRLEGFNQIHVPCKGLEDFDVVDGHISAAIGRGIIFRAHKSHTNVLAEVGVKVDERLVPWVSDATVCSTRDEVYSNNT